MAAIATVLELLDAGAHVRRARRPLRRHLPAVRARARRSAGLDFTYVDLRERATIEAALTPGHADDLGRDADQPAAQARGPRRMVAEIARARGILTVGGQHLRLALGPASARARLRHRGALGDQVPQRPFRHGRRRGRDGDRGAGRAAGVSAERGRRGRRVPSTASSHCAASRRWPCAWSATATTPLPLPSGWKAPQGRAGDLSGPREPSAARARPAPDARLRRHGLRRARRAGWRKPGASSSAADSSRSPRAWAASRA